MIKISMLVLAHNSRSIGYMSRKAKLAAIKQLPIANLALAEGKRLVWEGYVENDNLPYVERKLAALPVEYRKERGI